MYNPIVSSEILIVKFLSPIKFLPDLPGGNDCPGKRIVFLRGQLQIVLRDVR